MWLVGRGHWKTLQTGNAWESLLYPSLGQEDTFWCTSEANSCDTSWFRDICFCSVTGNLATEPFGSSFAPSKLHCRRQLWHVQNRSKSNGTSWTAISNLLITSTFLGSWDPTQLKSMGANWKWLILIDDFTSQILFLLAFDLGLKMWQTKGNTYFPLG